MEDLRQRRLDAGLTQIEIARRARCTGVHICMIEKGKARPSEDLRMRIEAALESAIPENGRPYRGMPMSAEEKKELHEIWIRRGYGEDRKGQRWR